MYVHLYKYLYVKLHTGVTWQTENRSSRDLNRLPEPADWLQLFPIFASPELGSLGPAIRLRENRRCFLVRSTPYIHIMDCVCTSNTC